MMIETHAPMILSLGADAAQMIPEMEAGEAEEFAGFEASLALQTIVHLHAAQGDARRAAACAKAFSPEASRLFTERMEIRCKLVIATDRVRAAFADKGRA